jgi:hypothetical protein
MATKGIKPKEGWTTVVPHPKDTPQANETITAKGAQTVSIRYGGDRKKTLIVDLWKDRPEFTFEGVWSGKDISIIKRHISKAYHVHTRELRRESIARFNQDQGANNE